MDQIAANTSDTGPDPPAGGGEMGALIRAKDWSATPLGPIESWSPALLMMTRILLVNRFPQLLWWGPEYISIYNDPYRPILGTKHPWALGQPVRDCWREVWHVLQPLIDTPFHGGPATWDDDIQLELDRNGFVEEAHFTIAYSPVPDDTAPNGIGGVLATVHEITEKVVAERRVVALRDLGARVSDVKTAEEACTIAAQVLDAHVVDVPFALLYLIGADGTQLQLAAAAGVDMDEEISPLVVELSDAANGLWPFADVLRSQSTQLVVGLHQRFTTLPAGSWSDPPDTAVVMPIPSNSPSDPAGVMVAGISARLKYDVYYQDFLDLVRAQVATAIANARAYEAERQRAESLADLDRAKTIFFSNVSHEFRTPLTLLLGPLEDMLTAGDDGSLSPLHREHLETAHRNALRLLRLVNTLLDFSRIDAGRIQATYERTDLTTFTADLASTFRSAIERAGLQLVVDTPPLPANVDVYVDRDMWEKIVLNLLSNAFKHTFTGKITVSLRMAPDRHSLVLTVEDTGTGIPKNELSRLFERFHRVQGAEARTHEGSGIGLALVQELVRLHSGTVAVDSEIGHGTRFTVTVPTGAAHLPAERIGTARPQRSTETGAAPFVQEALRWLPGAAEPTATSHSDEWGDPRDASIASHGAAPRRILLADDNADMRSYVARLLADRYDVEAVPDGEAALAAVHQNRPDLVLADIMMPRLDGVGLLHALRADMRTQNIPVLLLSARAGEEAKLEGIAAGADDYLVKPFTARDLRARIGAHLALARKRDEATERERVARAEAERIANDLEALRDELATQVDDLTRLHEYSVKLATPIGLSTVLEETLTTVASVLGSEMGLLILADHDQGDFRTAASLGLPNDVGEIAGRVSLGSGPIGRALTERRCIVIEDGEIDPDFVRYRDAAQLVGVRAVCCAPLVTVEGEVVGAVACFFPAPHHPSDRQVRLLELYARHAAEQIDHARLFQQTRDALQSRDAFLTAAAHDLKTPMTAIKGIAQILLRHASRENVQGAERLMTGLADIDASVTKMATQLDQLLDLARLEAGEPLPLQRRPTDLVSLVRRSSAQQKRTSSRHHIRVETVEPELVGSWDALRLARVLDNLIGNAIKYSPQGGEITLTLDRIDVDGRTWAVIAVHDQGVGIPDGDLPHVFERFHRGTNVNGAIFGSGIGLASAKQIIEQHGGNITVEHAVPRGSIFTVRLPLVPPSETA